MSATDNETWQCVMGSSGTMWPWWEDVEYHGGDWDNPCDVTFTVEDPHDDSGELAIIRRVTVADVVAAWEKARKVVPGLEGMECDDLDASSADIVLQYAVLGEYVYA